MSKILYFDCFSGASGDMILGALLDAGLSLDDLRSALGSLAIENVRLESEKVDRSGIGSTRFKVLNENISSESNDHLTHGHARKHTHHHRGLSEICAIVDSSALSSTAKDRAKHLFERLATVEAKIHQQSVETIHFHEVGAIDSIIDIVGAVFGLECLGAERIVSSALNVGSGTVKCEHGVMPVPAPATVSLMAGAPVYSTGTQAELLTPTGALLISDYAESYGPMPSMRIQRSGYGAGTRDFPGMPNVLRIVVGDDAASSEVQKILVIESEIDDMNPQIFGVLMDRLYAAGALDVFYTSIQMKKNRPGTLISTLSLPEHRTAISDVLFRETTTLGVRFLEMEREQLSRETKMVETPLGPVRFKVAYRNEQGFNVAPEFDDCVQLAEKHCLSIKEVQAIATKAYLDI